MAAKVMKKTIAGVLPTLQNSNLHPVRLDYFNHFINLKCIDFLYGNTLRKLKDTDKKVIDNTVNRYWEAIKKNTNSIQKDDLKIIALETVWKATEKYLCGIEKWNVKGKSKNNPIRVNYNREKNIKEGINYKFSFCKYANEQIKFKLRLVIYKDKITSPVNKLPDSSNIRAIFFNLNNWKISQNLHQKRCLNNEDIKELSFKFGYKFEDIKLVEDYQSQVLINGDNELSDDSDEQYWSVLKDENIIDNEVSSNNKFLIKKFNQLKTIFLKKPSVRDRYIFENYVLNKNYSLKDLALKYNLSQEGIRKISDRKFEEFKFFIFKHKKTFVDNKSGKLNLL